MRPSRRIRSRSPHRETSYSSDPLEHIKIPTPFDIQRFCSAVAEYRRRPLHLESVQGVAGAQNELCGLWVQFEHIDYILYEESTSPLHRDHIVLHEIGHILLEHSSEDTDSTGINVSSLFTGIDPATVRTVLGRASFTNRQEREAERFASRVARRAMLTPPARRRSPELDRLDTALRWK